MPSRREFLKFGSLGLSSPLFFQLSAEIKSASGFEGIVVNEEEGEAIQMRDGTEIVRIKIAKTQGAKSISFLSESFRPGDALPIT